VLDRVDASVLFDTPGEPERLRMLQQFWAEKMEARPHPKAQ
jgi:hypothetical protein